MAASENSNQRKKSSIKHTRSVQHDRTQRATGAPIESAIADRLTEIVHPATLPARRISRQAINTCLRVMPAQLFWNVLGQILPVLRVRWKSRQRSLSDVMDWAMAHYRRILICDRQRWTR